MLQPLKRKIDCVVRVVTPENIEFEYMVAGPFQRLPAFLIDYAVRVAAFVLLFLAMLFSGISLGSFGFSLLVTVTLLAFFVLSWIYGTYMETRFNGRTIGKMAMNLRVISADGRPINGTQAALRNMLRLCDFMPPLTLTLIIPDAPAYNVVPTCLVGLVAMMLSERMQRVGDLAANTMVVWEGRHGYNTNLQPEDPRAYALCELIPPTFQISRTLARAVALYMERRIHLSVMRREEIAGNLAKPLLEMFELRSDTSADLLLCAIYVRIYQSEDQRMAKLQAARRGGQVPNDQAARVGYQSSKPLSVPQPLAAQAARPVLAPAPTPGSAKRVNPYDDNEVLTAEILTAEVLPDLPAPPAPSAPRPAPAAPPAEPLISAQLVDPHSAGPSQSASPTTGPTPGQSYGSNPGQNANPGKPQP
jgi:uncharacterized RDD family membrane protein YckC